MTTQIVSAIGQQQINHCFSLYDLSILNFLNSSSLKRFCLLSRLQQKHQIFENVCFSFVDFILYSNLHFEVPLQTTDIVDQYHKFLENFRFSNRLRSVSARAHQNYKDKKKITLKP